MEPNETPPDQPQETEPPDLDLLLVVVHRLLTDLEFPLERHLEADLSNRVVAIRNAVVRLIESRRQ